MGVDIIPLHRFISTLRPLIHDYLHPRKAPLQISLLKGQLSSEVGIIRSIWCSLVKPAHVVCGESGDMAVQICCRGMIRT